MFCRYFKLIIVIVIFPFFAIANNVGKPLALHKGDTVALLASASAVTNKQIQDSINKLHSLGLNVKLGDYVNPIYQDGYFSAKAKYRAEDLNKAFADPDIKAIFEVRGGWGSTQLLPLIDYDQVKKTPKIIIGFSDITSLLLAINKEAGIVTFHGPLGIEPWPKFSRKYMKEILFDSKKVTFKSATHVQTIYPGKATGVLVGGNISNLVALIGTKYEPNWKGKIIFIENIGERNYQIDRMMNQLQLAGVLSKINGFVFGECTRCEKPIKGEQTFKNILKYYLVKDKVPSFMGASFGHGKNNFTLPIGVNAEINADTKTIKMLTSATKS
ncbi:peptidase U61 [Francisella halioticida]|uniref:LD-carboxypeptidase n=1 Tax=Francisella halioticida TaxID=549298 RepID=A0ABM6LZM7_9GAMM|nr:LD-carboxypeptidase [Francisella halioticida]ASG68108.1 LD-carboxypeptidase [Francisella halioticida]BCD90870.1 peptidase U61 [Francisella halioticida]